ncbi:MAG: D-alanine--D-alanine ligase [Rhodospirillaceae bacterium]|nr:D-alanine--D-alanine ligase [Rhodospirillaceae bacterium]|tara:strand:- start:3754 stop:4674 length:921 start_codon:yes stop_codon:yes gene_type:complete
MKKRVAVLMGGISSEREVSLVSGKSVVKALKRKGYETNPIDVGQNLKDVMNALKSVPDAVFNALHGRYGEDGCIQGLLELLSIPYTHSNVLASALAMDKPMAKKLFWNAGIPCAKHRLVKRHDIKNKKLMDQPYVIKPLNEGSSLGVQIVQNGGDVPMLQRDIGIPGDQVMIEEYIPGRELTVAVMGDRALGVTELKTDNGFYDYGAKYTKGKTTHHIPAALPEIIYKNAMRYALKAHDVLGCQGVTRADLRYNDTKADPGQLVMLEVNTQPGMTPLSLVPEQAAYVGIDFEELVSWIVENAQCGN